MPNRSWISTARVCLALVLGLGGPLACESSQPNDGSLNGSWDVEEEVDAGECDEGMIDESYRIKLVVDGAKVLVRHEGGEFAATQTGNELAWTSIYDEDDGTTTSLIQVRFDEERNSFSGIASWSWKGDTDSCTGTSTLEGTRS